MSRWPAWRAYSWSTWKQIQRRLGGSEPWKRPPVEATASGSCEARIDAGAGGVLPQQRDHVLQAAPGVHLPAALGVAARVGPRVVDRLAEEAPHEPAPLHQREVLQELERRPPGRHAWNPQLGSGQRAALLDAGVAVEVEVRREVLELAARPDRPRPAEPGAAPRGSRLDPPALGVPVRLDLLGRLHPRRLAGHLGVVRREVQLAARSSSQSPSSGSRE